MRTKNEPLMSEDSEVSSPRTEESRVRQTAWRESEREGVGRVWSCSAKRERKGRSVSERERRVKRLGHGRRETYVNESALLVGLLDREESVKNEELDDGENPGVLLGDGSVLDESEHLVESPSPSSLDSLEVEPERKANKEGKRVSRRSSVETRRIDPVKLWTHSSEAPREL